MAKKRSKSKTKAAAKKVFKKKYNAGSLVTNTEEVKEDAVGDLTGSISETASSLGPVGSIIGAGIGLMESQGQTTESLFKESAKHKDATDLSGLILKGREEKEAEELGVVASLNPLRNAEMALSTKSAKAALKESERALTQKFTTQQADKEAEEGFFNLRAKGGKIIGKGTGTSDDVPMKANPGDFIVIAKMMNNPTVKNMFQSLGMNKTAEKGGGSEEILASNGEGIIPASEVPKAVKFLNDNGMTLKDLAPKGQFACGGSVKKQKGGTISPKAKEGLKEHGKSYSKAHVSSMKDSLKKGSSFKQAHKAALKVGKKDGGEIKSAVGPKIKSNTDFLRNFKEGGYVRGGSVKSAAFRTYQGGGKVDEFEGIDLNNPDFYENPQNYQDTLNLGTGTQDPEGILTAVFNLIPQDQQANYIANVNKYYRIPKGLHVQEISQSGGLKVIKTVSSSPGLKHVLSGSDREKQVDRFELSTSRDTGGGPIAFKYYKDGSKEIFSDDEGIDSVGTMEDFKREASDFKTFKAKAKEEVIEEPQFAKGGYVYDPKTGRSTKEGEAYSFDLEGNVYGSDGNPLPKESLAAVTGSGPNRLKNLFLASKYKYALDNPQSNEFKEMVNLQIDNPVLFNKMTQVAKDTGLEFPKGSLEIQKNLASLLTEGKGLSTEERNKRIDEAVGTKTATAEDVAADPDKSIADVVVDGTDVSDTKQATTNFGQDEKPKTEGDDKQGSTTLLDVIGLGQAAIGATGLIGARDEPEFVESKELQEQFEQAKRDATFGFDPIERTIAERGIETTKREGLGIAKILSSRSAITAQAVSNVAIQKANDAKLNLEALDQRIQREKERNVLPLLSLREGERRFKFLEEERRYERDIRSLSGLLRSGVANLEGSAERKDVNARLSDIYETGDTFG